MAPTPAQSQRINARKLTGKQPKARVQRYLKKQQSQLVEPARHILLLKGIRCSDAMTTVLRDLRAMKAPQAKLLQKNNSIVAFDGDEGVNSLEFLTTKNDCSLFALASHNKKRPNNLILGRTFDRKILDMAELGITYYKSISDYKGAPKKRTGSKPLMFFDGDLWEHNGDMFKLKNLLIDSYRGDPVSKLILSGVDHLITFTASEQPQENNSVGIVVHMRTFFVKLKKHPQGEPTPVPFLIPCGPDMDFKVSKYDCLYNLMNAIITYNVLTFLHKPQKIWKYTNAVEKNSICNTRHLETSHEAA